MRPRSPRYPFISLPRALARASQLHSALIELNDANAMLAPRAGLSAQEAATAWSKIGKSSAIAQTVSALKQYGLIERDAERSERQIVLSALAHRILRDRNDVEAVQEAAQNPTVLREIWDRIQAGHTDYESLVQWLTREGRFTPRAAEDVLGIFRETMIFAGLTPGPSGERADVLIPKQEAFAAEEVLALGKIRIQYRSRPSRRDYEEVLAHFETKLRHVD